MNYALDTNIISYILRTATLIYSKRKKQGRPIEDTDLLIAAQCVTNGYTLVTNNMRHFDNIDGLSAVNWKEQ